MPNSGIKRKRCFFDISISNKDVGRIVFELYNDLVSKTVDNFVALCDAQIKKGPISGCEMSYAGTIFHRVIKGFMIQGGDFVSHNGEGGESIYGEYFDDEKEGLKLEHNRSGLLSMANIGENTNGSQFFITCAPCPHLNGKHVIFGEVVKGMNIVRKIEHVNTDDDDKPITDVVIVRCGSLNEESDDSDVESGELVETENEIVEEKKDDRRVDVSGRKVKGRGMMKFLKNENEDLRRNLSPYIKKENNGNNSYKSHEYRKERRGRSRSPRFYESDERSTKKRKSSSPCKDRKESSRRESRSPFERRSTKKKSRSPSYDRRRSSRSKRISRSSSSSDRSNERRRSSRRKRSTSRSSSSSSSSSRSRSRRSYRRKGRSSRNRRK